MNNTNYHFFMTTYVLLNGMATGHLINLAHEIRDNVFTTDMAISVALTAGAALYTAKRIRDVWRDQQNQNQK